MRSHKINRWVIITFKIRQSRAASFFFSLDAALTEMNGGIWRMRRVRGVRGVTHMRRVVSVGGGNSAGWISKQSELWNDSSSGLSVFVWKLKHRVTNYHQCVWHVRGCTSKKTQIKNYTDVYFLKIKKKENRSNESKTSIKNVFKFESTHQMTCSWTCQVPPKRNEIKNEFSFVFFLRGCNQSGRDIISCGMWESKQQHTWGSRSAASRHKLFTSASNWNNEVKLVKMTHILRSFKNKEKQSKKLKGWKNSLTVVCQILCKFIVKYWLKMLVCELFKMI